MTRSARTAVTANERELLGAARTGDENAFGRLVGPYRVELHAHCYRMLGSVPDAEDALQDALLSAWRGLPRFEGRSSLRSWLYKIATNACLKAIERRPKRVLPIDYGPAADPHDGPAAPVTESVWLEPTLTRASDSRAACWGRTLATNSTRASSSPSLPHCSTCPRDSGPS